MHDIPLLAETGQAADFDAVVVVDVPEELQVERMVRDRGWTRREARVADRGPGLTRGPALAIATYVIDNTGTLEDLRQRVAEVFDGKLDRRRRLGGTDCLVASTGAI